MFFIPTQINLGDFKINNTDQSSSISIGSTVKTRRNVSAKKNQGFGQQQSDSSIQCATEGITLDQEIADCFSIKING